MSFFYAIEAAKSESNKKAEIVRYKTWQIKPGWAIL